MVAMTRFLTSTYGLHVEKPVSYREMMLGGVGGINSTGQKRAEARRSELPDREREEVGQGKARQGIQMGISSRALLAEGNAARRTRVV